MFFFIPGVSIVYYYVIILLLLCPPVKSGLNITIVHTNDVHARFQSYNSQTKSCSKWDVDNHQCWGGAARRMTALKQIRQDRENVLLLDAGDQFQGTGWYALLKWHPIAAVMNAMNYTVMALGNHEFDDGLDGLTPFVENVTFPIVAANLIAQGTNLENKYKAYIELNVENSTVAIIGYITPETATLSEPGPLVKFEDEIVSLKRTVAELKSRGVNKIIALGHSGINVDRDICRMVEGVDVVVGGHTHTFLYTGQPPSSEKAEGPYPEVFMEKDIPCLVVHAYAYSKYLGLLELTFDDNGVLKNWNGNPILVDHTYEEDATIRDVLTPFQVQYNSRKRVIVGQTAVALESGSCRIAECNMGNIVADSMFRYYLKQKWKNINDSVAWSYANLAVINGGGVRDFHTDPGTVVTDEDLYLILPFSNTIELIDIRGEHILKAFEHSVENFSAQVRHGKFLQISGAKVVYDLSKPNGKRVQSLLVLCTNCTIPVYEKVDPERVYKMVIGNFMTKGGDGYDMIKNNYIRSDRADVVDVDILKDYLKDKNPLINGIEGRITFVSDKNYQSVCQVMF